MKKREIGGREIKGGSNNKALPLKKSNNKAQKKSNKALVMLQKVYCNVLNSIYFLAFAILIKFSIVLLQIVKLIPL